MRVVFVLAVGTLFQFGGPGASWISPVPSQCGGYRRFQHLLPRWRFPMIDLAVNEAVEQFVRTGKNSNERCETITAS